MTPTVTGGERVPYVNLTTEQKGRVEALAVAAQVLNQARRPDDEAASPIDVHALAVFILTGQDPFVSLAEAASRDERCGWIEDGLQCVQQAGHEWHEFDADDPVDPGGSVVSLRTIAVARVDADDDPKDGDSP